MRCWSFDLNARSDVADTFLARGQGQPVEVLAAESRSFYVERALRLFWQRGYDNATMREVVDALELNRFTLYRRFGDKRQLLSLTIDHYLRQTLAVATSRLGQSRRGRRAVEEYLVEMLGVATAGSALGCFLLNTAMDRAERDPELTRTCEAHFARVEQQMTAALRAECGEPPERSGDAAASARLLVLATQGLMVQARLGRPREALLTLARELSRPIPRGRFEGVAALVPGAPAEPQPSG